MNIFEQVANKRQEIENAVRQNVSMSFKENLGSVSTVQKAEDAEFQKAYQTLFGNEFGGGN